MSFADTFDNDPAYMASSEIMFFVRHLFSQVAALRPDDIIDFAAKFFKRIQSCQHVLGAEYAYIGATAHNRRAFIFCLTEIFASFSADESMSVAEHEQLVEMVCPDFPRNMMHAAAACCDPAPKAAEGTGVSGLGRMHSTAPVAEKAPGKCWHAHLRVALYFHILYEEWLKYIETIFREEGNLDCLSMFRLRAYLEDCRKNWNTSFSQPPANGVSAALASITAKEISFTALLKAMFDCVIVQEDVLCTPPLAWPLLTDGPGRRGSGAGAGAGGGAGAPAGTAGGSGAGAGAGAGDRAGDGTVSPRRSASAA